jgi:hypothetical protein
MAAGPIVVEDRAKNAWRGLTPGMWQRGVNVREFIQRSYAPTETAAARDRTREGRTGCITGAVGNLGTRTRLHRRLRRPSNWPLRSHTLSPGGLQFAGEFYVFGVSRIVGKRFTSANIVGRGFQRPMA